MPRSDSRGRGPAEPDHGLADRFAELGRISAELLHDLAGSLSLVSSRVAVARHQAELGEVPLPELVALQRESDELRAMLTEILDELRSPTRSPERTFSPAEEVERAIDRWYQGGTGVPVRLRSDLSDGAQVMGPRTLFARTVTNLLRNASRHARSRVSVSLRMGNDEADVELWVEDDGTGVPREMLGALFEPMSASVRGGHGLGLSFCQWAAARLGGKLEYVGPSRRLGGASFRLRVPLSARSTRVRPPPPVPAPAPEAPRRAEAVRGLVLVVDDDLAVSSALTRRLQREGWDARAVSVAGSVTVPELVERIRAARPCLVLVDQGLGRISGMDVVRGLGASAKVPVATVLMTGGETASLTGHGVSVFHKLDGWDEILRVLDEALEASGQAVPPHRG
jgi:CheY-like chemotaxis protein/two-component sensor histidine kinase